MTISINHVVRRVLNFTLDPTPIELKREDISTEGMTSMLYGSDHQYLSSTVEFHPSSSWNTYGRHDRKLRHQFKETPGLCGPPESLIITGSKGILKGFLMRSKGF